MRGRAALLGTFLVLVAAVVAGPFASTGAATPSQSVTFNSQIVIGPFTGTWSASGALTDSGSLIEPSVNLVGNGQLQIERVMTGSNGTITIRIQSEITSVVGDVVTFDGHWVVVSGTGSYANLHGHGDRNATAIAGVVTETLTGEAHFD